MLKMLTTSIRVSQADFCVTDIGHGPAVIFLHAGVADRRMWAAQQAHLRNRYRTIAYDRRGFGATTVVAETFSHVSDLLALMDALDIAAAVLVGCSMGGALAMAMALAHPDRARGLVIVASAPGATETPPQHSAFVQARLAALAAAEATNDLVAVNDIEARLWLDGPDQPTGRVSGAVRDLFLDMNSIALRAGDVGENLRGPAVRGRLSEVRVPALLLAGELDFSGINAGMQEIAAQLPRAIFHCIPGCAHLPSMEQPEVVNDYLRGFLESLVQ